MTRTVGFAKLVPALVLVLGLAAMTISIRSAGAQTAPPEGDPPKEVGDTPKEDPKPRMPTAEELLDEGRKDVKPVLPGRDRPVDTSLLDGDMERKEGMLLPEGYQLVKRPGRMVEAPDGGWQYAFEERGTGIVEPPMKLLPSRMLELMEAESRGATNPIVFEVSGKVTEYRGRNYLLVENVLIRVNLGNLK